MFCGESTISSTIGEESEPGLAEGTDLSVRPSDLLLVEEGTGRSGALGRKVSALASRKALCKELSLMNLEDVRRDLG